MPGILSKQSSPIHAFLPVVLKEARFEHLVYLSSTRLYDTLDAEIAQEDMPLYLSPIQPRHIYDLSKALGENMCLTITDGRASVARLACVFGTVAGTPGFRVGVAPAGCARKTIPPAFRHRLCS